MNFIKGFSISSFASVIILTFGFLNNILITRYLGPEGRGIYAVLSNFIILALLLLGEGVRRRNTLLVGQKKKIRDLVFTQSMLLITIFFLFLIITSSNSSVFYSFLKDVPKVYLIITSFTIVFMIGWQSVQAIFLGLEKIYWFNLIAIISPILILFVNLIGIYFFDFDLIGIIITQSIASFVALTVGIIMLKPKLMLKEIIQLTIDKESSSIIAKSTISSVSFFIAYRSPIFFINYFLGPVQAGLFSIINSFIDLLQRIPNEAGAILISKTAQKDDTKSHYYTTRLVRIFLFINIFIVLFFFLFGKLLIDFLFGTSYSDSYFALLWSLPAIQFYSIGLILNAYYMGKRYPKFMLINNILFGLFTFISFFIFIPNGSIYLAAKICSILVVLWTFSFLVYFKKSERIKFNHLLIIQKEDLKLFGNAIGRMKIANRK